MMRAQDLIEKITSRATCDDCIVIVKDKTQANLRWASSTLTTNGVIQERSITVIAFVAASGSMSMGAVTRTNVGEGDIDSILAEAISLAKASGPARDYMPLAKDVAMGDWSAEHQPTGPEVFAKFAPELGEMMSRSVKDSIELFGYAEHQRETTWVGSKGGIRLRSDAPIGRIEMTGKSHERTRSTWEGVETHDFSNINVAEVDQKIRQRLEWQARKVELPAGKYDTIFPSGSVADLFTYFLWSASAQSAHDGQSVFSKKGGGTRVGEKFSDRKINIYSDPASTLLPGSPFIAHPSSSEYGSIFDNGQKTGRIDWLRDGVLQSLIQTRATAELTKLPFTPMTDNVFMDIEGGQGDLNGLIKGMKHGLLLTTLWYIRMVDPNSLLLTGLTRDGVYYVKDGEVQGVTNNFRWNDSPVSALGRISEASASEWSQPREWAGDIFQMHVPAVVIRDFNMSTVSPGN
jgi:predicted Zn-dependent protease